MVIRTLAQPAPASRSCGTRAPCAPQRGGRAMHGFTVIELMVVVAILVILLSIAGPDFRSMIAATRIKTASFDVFSSIVQARSEAITRNTTVTMAPAGGNWANGWTVTESGGTVVRRQDPYPSITIEVVTGPNTVTFNGMGRLNGAASSFSLTATGASAASSRCISIDLSGRPVTKTGACS